MQTHNLQLTGASATQRAQYAGSIRKAILNLKGELLTEHNTIWIANSLLKGKLQGKLPELKAIVQYTGRLVTEHVDVYDVSGSTFVVITTTLE